VIGIVTDDDINMGRRIEAAELLIQHNVPDPVARAARRFLCEVVEDKAGFPGHRLAAARAVMRRDLGKFKRQRIVPLKYDQLRESRHLTATQMIEDGLRRTAERDAKLRLMASTEPADVEPEPKAG
jgi:hypothetical protein